MNHTLKNCTIDSLFDLRLYTYYSIILILLIVLNTSCGKKHLVASLEKVSSVDVPVSKVSYADSASTKFFHAVVSIETDYPTDDYTLISRNIREWISEELGGIYNGNMTDGKKLISFYAQNQMNDFKHYHNETDTFMLHCYWNVAIKKIYETSEFVTYSISKDEFWGGAHGTHDERGMTFRKIDGRRIDWSFFKDSKHSSLQNLVKQAIMKQYFKTDNETEFLQVDLQLADTLYGFPLPETTPIFVENGIKFTYQQYEIACYAAGLPTCTIPYAAFDTLFTQTGKSLTALQ